MCLFYFKKQFSNMLENTNDLLFMKKKFGLSEDPLKISILKDEDEMANSGDTHYVCYLRKPDRADVKELMRLMSEPIDFVDKALEILWLEGDQEIIHNQDLSMSCIGLINQLFRVREVEYSSAKKK
jgi:hypothetical protein